ncbi:MAG: helix-turn-helix domain-containing protein [Imperialibacter sp.]|uniref:helix-turn-helix domain-containing protein n=1 Tax=Imperialibacter sp. TaxID=2038411 RepID=UPI0032EB7893
MSANDIVLVIVSGLGVIHGLFLSIFLWIYSKGNSLSNKLLSVLLIVLSFRIGKSVFLEFAEHLDVKLIFVGLGTIMAIGPLFYLFAQSCVRKAKSLDKLKWVHFVPALVGVWFGLWLDEPDLETIPKWVFAILFLTYYLHFIIYLVAGHSYIRRHRLELNQDVWKLLLLLFYALLAIWTVYVLNLFDETVPYIVGPVLYSFVAYVVSFEVIRKGYIAKIHLTKYKTTPASEEQIDQLFERVLKIVVEDSQYKNPDLSLNSLSKAVHASPQMLSMAINQKSAKNFNSFVNTYRIQEATRLLQNSRYDNLTVAAIAFEVGFNSISSFNTAFKTQTGQTPQTYRKQLPK